MKLKPDDIARPIDERVESELEDEGRRRGLESDRLRVTYHDGTVIASLPLPNRLTNAPRRAGVETLGNLNGLSEDELCP